MRWLYGLSLLLTVSGCGLVPGIPCTEEPVEGEPSWCEAHRQRNQYQEAYCPLTRPPENYVDPETGIYFGTEASWDFYHWPDTCVRGTGGVLYTMDYDSDTMDMLIALGADPEALNPGIQCCYDSETDELTDSGTYDFQTPPNPLEFLFSPIRAFYDMIRHITVDVWPFGEIWGYEFPFSSTTKPS